jgi:hypothetical protein
VTHFIRVFFFPNLYSDGAPGPLGRRSPFLFLRRTPVFFMGTHVLEPV